MNSSPTTNDHQAAARAIQAATSLVISSHVNPDGDAIGAILGAGLSLTAAGKRCLVVNPDEVPWTFQMLPQAGIIKRWDALAAFGRPDLWLALDSADARRLGLPQDAAQLLQGVPIVQLDHHVTNNRYASVNLIEPSAVAVCEQLATFLPAYRFPITPDAATALLCGLTTDSGGFRFAAVTAGTFRAAATLMDLGGSQAEVGKLLGIRRLAQVRLAGLVAGSLQSHAHGRIIEADLTRSMFDAAGVASDEGEGVIEAVRGIEGADITVLLREEPNGEIKVSFRTTEAVDATILATAFGGGGHPRAAGCTVPGPLDHARALVIGQAKALLAKQG
jgi:phosphoesterase RecJ-like protein